MKLNASEKLLQKEFPTVSEKELEAQPCYLCASFNICVIVNWLRKSNYLSDIVISKCRYFHIRIEEETKET